MKNWLKIFVSLGKVRITVFVSITTALGYILAAEKIDMNLIYSVLGVFILSCGCSALNQYQERKYDTIMERTKKRPIPSQLISAKTGFLISMIMILLGEYILVTFSGMNAFLLGLLSIYWYNFLYTPLKRITSLAVVPGALIGAIPPAIGWVSGGGAMFSPQIIALGLFFFIWQIPHFWLLVLIFDKDYRSAGFPTLTQVFSNEQLTKITYIWIAALTASCMLIPLYGLSKNIYTTGLLMTAGLWLLWRTKNLLSQYENKKIIKFAFMNINYYVLIVVLLLSVDRFFNH